MISVAVFFVSIALFSPVLSANDCACGLESVSSRIAYGSVAEQSKYSWVTLLEIKSGNEIRFCTGTLVGKKTVLTAAHCFLPTDVPASVTAYVGAHDKNKLPAASKVAKIVKDKKFEENNIPTVGHDIAAVILEAPVEDNKIVPICVPSETKARHVKQFLDIAGWGKDEKGEISQQLKHVRVKHLNFFDCVRKINAAKGIEGGFKKGDKEKKFPITDICATNPVNGVSACEDDSGAPLMWKAENGLWYLIGVFSRGEKDCSRKDGLPGFYTRANQFLKYRSLKQEFDHSDVCFKKYE